MGQGGRAPKEGHAWVKGLATSSAQTGRGQGQRVPLGQGVAEDAALDRFCSRRRSTATAVHSAHSDNQGFQLIVLTSLWIDKNRRYPILWIERIVLDA